MSDKLSLLFVDDEEEFVNYMSKRLTARDFEVTSFTNAAQALAKTADQTFDVALIDLKMPEMDGEELLHKLKDRDPLMEIIILTGHGTIKSATRTTKAGAYEYLLKPCEFDDLITSITNAYAKRMKNINADKDVEINKVIENALGKSPIQLLNELKKLNQD